VPIRGTIAGTIVYVLDASPGGLQIAHRTDLPSPGDFCRLDIQSNLGPVKLDCQVVRTTNDSALHHSGLEIVAADRQSSERLRSLFA
jgi:hypothetical protein